MSFATASLVCAGYLCTLLLSGAPMPDCMVLVSRHRATGLPNWPSCTRAVGRQFPPAACCLTYSRTAVCAACHALGGQAITSLVEEQAYHGSLPFLTASQGKQMATVLVCGLPAGTGAWPCPKCASKRTNSAANSGSRRDPPLHPSCGPALCCSWRGRVPHCD